MAIEGVYSQSTLVGAILIVRTDNTVNTKIKFVKQKTSLKKTPTNF